MIQLPRPLRWLWSRARETRTTVVVCPSAKLPAKVELDATERMRACSRWAEMQNTCVEGCKPQLEFSSEDLEGFTNLFEGHPCASCGATLTADDWYKSRLASLAPEITTTQAPDETGHGPKCDPVRGPRV